LTCSERLHRLAVDREQHVARLDAARAAGPPTSSTTRPWSTLGFALLLRVRGRSAKPSCPAGRTVAVSNLLASAPRRCRACFELVPAAVAPDLELDLPRPARDMPIMLDSSPERPTGCAVDLR
jgi:hypothetical protein